jgi:hypothetical protein
MLPRVLVALVFLASAPAALAAQTRDWTPRKLPREELLAKSRLVVVAEPDVASDEIVSPEPCLAVARAFVVRSVVRNLTNVQTPPGTRIRVLPYVYFQMKNRCKKDGWVRTFAQEQYFPKKLPARTEPAILFLMPFSGQFYFQAIDSLESATLLKDVIEEAPLRCPELQTRYREFLDGLPGECQADADCAAYEYDLKLGACGREVYHRHSVQDATLDFLGLVARKAAELCGSPLQPCERIPARPACRAGKCVNLLRQPDMEMFSADGSVRPTCAPTDGPALQFVAPVKGQEASVRITLYRNFPPAGQPFVMSWGELSLSDLWKPQGTSSAFSAIYCPGKQTCAPAESGKFVLEKFGGDSEPSRGEFTLKLRDGITVHGKTLFRPAPKESSPHPCG